MRAGAGGRREEADGVEPPPAALRAPAGRGACDAGRAPSARARPRPRPAGTATPPTLHPPW